MVAGWTTWGLFRIKAQRITQHRAASITPSAVSITLFNRDSSEPMDIGRPVSVQEIDANHILVCNYQTLYLIDIRDGNTRPIPAPPEVKQWVPTCVYYISELKSLFVANYTGHDVLKFYLTPNYSLELKQRITHPDLQSPEGVAVSANGENIFVADQDGNAVFCFDRDGAKRWSAPLLSAHGIAINQEAATILATGLAPPRIVKFDFNGRELASHNFSGWGRDEYLWPICLAISKEGNIAVSDAHTGRIRLLNSELKQTAEFGANGLGPNFFNMPYGISWTDRDSLWVTDTFKCRLLELDIHFRRFTREYISASMTLAAQYKVMSSAKLPAEELKKPIGILQKRRDRLVLSAEAWGHGYITRVNESPTARIDLTPLGLGSGSRWRPGYRKLVRDDGQVTVRFQGAEAFFGSDYYWIEGRSFIYDGRPVVLLGSPQNPVWIVIFDGGFTLLPLGVNFWISGNDLATDTGLRIPLELLAREGRQSILRIHQQIADGVSPLQIFRSYFPPFLEGEAFAKSFRAVFRTSMGKELAETCLNPAKQGLIRPAAQKVVQESLTSKTIYLPEFMLARMLADFEN